VAAICIKEERLRRVKESTCNHRIIIFFSLSTYSRVCDDFHVLLLCRPTLDACTIRMVLFTVVRGISRVYFRDDEASNEHPSIISSKILHYEIQETTNYK
jgi:hypothetical protein